LIFGGRYAILLGIKKKEAKMLAQIACMFLTVGVMFSGNSNHIQGKIMVNAPNFVMGRVV